MGRACSLVPRPHLLMRKNSRWIKSIFLGYSPGSCTPHFFILQVTKAESGGLEMRQVKWSSIPGFINLEWLGLLVFASVFLVVYRKNMITTCCEKTRVSLMNDVFRTFRKPVCHCKKGIVIMTDSLLFQIQMSEHNSLLCGELHDNLFLILSQLSSTFSYHLGNYLCPCIKLVHSSATNMTNRWLKRQFCSYCVETLDEET